MRNNFFKVNQTKSLTPLSMRNPPDFMDAFQQMLWYVFLEDVFEKFHLF